MLLFCAWRSVLHRPNMLANVRPDTRWEVLCNCRGPHAAQCGQGVQRELSGGTGNLRTGALCEMTCRGIRLWAPSRRHCVVSKPHAGHESQPRVVKVARTSEERISHPKRRERRCCSPLHTRTRGWGKHAHYTDTRQLPVWWAARRLVAPGSAATSNGAARKTSPVRSLWVCSRTVCPPLACA